MTTSTLGLLAGLLVTIAIVTGGLTGLLLAVMLGGAGYLVGAHLDGQVDLRELFRSRRG